MNKKAFNILRLGLAITFIWIGVMILQDPIAWAGYIQPWALKFIPGSLSLNMQITGIMDVAVGLLLLVNSTVWIGALFGAVHLVVVLITSGITEITVRDIGLLFASVALFMESMPMWLSDKFLK